LIAVVGPLADTLYTDWYSGRLPYRVTPLDGIGERAATVTSQGVDRSVLKSGGRYLTAGTGAGADLRLSGTYLVFRGDLQVKEVTFTR